MLVATRWNITVITVSLGRIHVAICSATSTIRIAAVVVITKPSVWITIWSPRVSIGSLLSPLLAFIALLCYIEESTVILLAVGRGLAALSIVQLGIINLLELLSSFRA